MYIHVVCKFREYFWFWGLLELLDKRTYVHSSAEHKMASFKGVNHGLPAPLDSEYPEVAWGIGK